MASRWVASLVALEIKAARRSTRTPDEIRQLIREMSVANPLWGAPRIHGELLKLGMDVGQTTVAKYMAKRRRRRRRAGGPLFTITPTPSCRSTCSWCRLSFGLLYGLLILRQSRRELLWLGVTAHPNAEWVACQLTEACGWGEPPRYLIRDRDGAYGAAFIRRIRAMGIRDRPSVCKAARERNSPATAHQINLRRSPIAVIIDQFAGDRQLFWVYGRYSHSRGPEFRLVLRHLPRGRTTCASARTLILVTRF
jgi:hypothetical protein